MRVTELLANVAPLHGQSVQVEGRLVVIFERGTYFPFMCSGDRLRRTNHIRVQQPFAELRQIIQPMSLHLLQLERGYMKDKPYLYNFPLTLRGTVQYNAEEELPLLRDVTAVHLRIPYTDRLRTLVDAPEWEYRAEVTYSELNNLQQIAEHRAQIRHERILHFSMSRPDVEPLQHGETRYARQLVQKTLQIPGDFSFGSAYSLLRTDALREGLLPRPTQPAQILLPASSQDRIIRICGGLNPLLYPADVEATVTGKIRYRRANEPGSSADALSKLTFSRIYRIAFSGERTLRHRHPKPQLL